MQVIRAASSLKAYITLERVLATMLSRRCFSTSDARLIDHTSMRIRRRRSSSDNLTYANSQTVLRSSDCMKALFKYTLNGPWIDIFECFKRFRNLPRRFAVLGRRLINCCVTHLTNTTSYGQHLIDNEQDSRPPDSTRNHALRNTVSSRCSAAFWVTP